ARVLAVPAQRDVDLATAELRGDALAEIAFQRTQLLGQPQADLEVAVIHRAQLPGKAPPGATRFTPGESGHALNHFGSWNAFWRRAGLYRRARKAGIIRTKPARPSTNRKSSGGTT